MSSSCRELDADRIVEFLEEDPRHELTLGRLAHLLNRSVRYVHSIAREDARLKLDTELTGGRVSNITAAIKAKRSPLAAKDQLTSGGIRPDATPKE